MKTQKSVKNKLVGRVFAGALLLLILAAACIVFVKTHLQNIVGLSVPHSLAGCCWFLFTFTYL